MPTLSSAFSVRHLSLPSFSDADLTVVDRVSVKDVSDSELQGNNMLKSLYLASRMIRSWNFVDAEGKPLEISVETLSAFPVEDVNFLIEQVVIPAVQKKNRLREDVIVNALRGRGKADLMVLTYVLAKNFNCSPVSLLGLDLDQFYTFVEIMRVDQLLTKRHEQ